MTHIDQPQISKQQIAVAIILVIGLYVIVPQFGDFSSSLDKLRNPELSWVVLGIIFTILTYFAGALTYCLLAFHKLRYLEVVLVQFAAMFVNRLLPAGIGAVGANFVYLKHRKQSALQAGAMVGINNLLGLLGHGLLIGLAFLLYGNHLEMVSRSSQETALRMIGFGLALGIIAAIIFARHQFVIGIRKLISQLKYYQRRPLRIPLALGSSTLLTLANVCCLAACAQALGVSLSLASILIILTFGVGAGAATPTPGGLGGFEAGLAAGLIAYGVPQSTALAIALLYRLISYWLVLIMGAIAFIVCQKRGLLKV